MANKFGKFLMFTAAAAAVGGAAYYYMKKKDAELMAELDEDYDNFGEDLEEEEPQRSYVPLTYEEGTTPVTEVSSAPKAPIEEVGKEVFEDVVSAESPVEEPPVKDDVFEDVVRAESLADAAVEEETVEESEEFFTEEDSLTSAAEETVPEVFTPLSEVTEDILDEVEETVEEFFDEDEE